MPTSLQYKLSEKIREFGFTFLGVAADEETGAPGFTYTVGRCLTGQPEIIITGNISPATCQIIIANIVELAGNKSIETGERTDLANIRFHLNFATASDLFDNYLVQVPYVTYRKPENIQVIQAVWADNNNVLPWEPGYNHEQFQQPLLFTPANKLN